MLLESLHDCGQVSDFGIELNILNEVCVGGRLQYLGLRVLIGNGKGVEKLVDVAHLLLHADI